MKKYTIDAKTASGAANATAKALNKEAVSMGASPSAKVVKMLDNGIANHYVFWEEGPSNWSTLALAEGNIWGEELTGSLVSAFKMPATFNFINREKYFVDCESSYALVFGKN